MNAKANHGLFQAITGTLKPIHESAPETGSFEEHEAKVKDLFAAAAAHIHIHAAHNALFAAHQKAHGADPEAHHDATNPHQENARAASSAQLTAVVDAADAHNKLAATYPDKAKPAAHYFRAAHQAFTDDNTKYYGSDDPMYKRGA